MDCLMMEHTSRLVLAIGQYKWLEKRGEKTFARSIGCRLKTPHYMPIYTAKCMWDGVEEKLRRKLVTWKTQYLYNGGRLPLIRSTLMSILTMSLFKIPKGVVSRLEKMQRLGREAVSNLNKV